MRRTAVLLAAALLLPACGDDDPKPSASSAAPSPTVAVPLPSGTPTPVIPMPKPTTLTRTDLIEGTGRTAVPGNALTVNYVGVHYDGKVFDTSYGKNPLTFILGGDEVIPGWDQGLIGMRVGGRRQLVIPPELAYGAEGYQGEIAPNETLVFVVDLLNVDPGIGGPATFGPQ